MAANCLGRWAAALVATVVLGSGCAHGQPGARDGTLRIYLARHGLTDWNAQQRLQGWSDVPLNATGREQARALAEALRGIPVRRVYSGQEDSADNGRKSGFLFSLNGMTITVMTIPIGYGTRRTARRSAPRGRSRHR